MVYLAGIGAIFFLRLGIWRFFPGLEFAIKDDLSNMIVACAIFGLAFFFFVQQACRREGLLKSGLEGPLALFISAAAVSFFWTADVEATFRATIMLLAYVFLFLILLQILAVEYHRRIFFGIFFIGSVVVAGYGLNDMLMLSRVSPEEVEAARLTNKSLYYILTHKRACSLFGWPNVLAGFLMLAMPLTAALLISVRAWWLRLLLASGAAMMVAAFFFTFSFLGWSGFLLTAGVILGVLVHQRIFVMPSKIIRYLAFGVMVAAVLFAGVVLKKDFAESMVPRKEYTRVVRAVIGEHPFLGSGFGAYRFASMRFVTSNDGETAFPHNSYAQVWAETGLPGVAAVFWLIILVVFLAQRVLRRVGDGKEKLVFIAVFTGLAAFLVDNINSFTMLKPNASFFFWTWLALFCSYGLTQEQAFPSAVKWRRGVMAVFAAVAVAGFSLSMRQVLSLSALRSGHEAVRAGVAELARGHFQRAHTLDPLNTAPLTAQADLYLRLFRSTARKEWLEAAEVMARQAVQCAPYYHYNYLILASVHALRGNQVAADRMVARAMAVSPYETQRDLAMASRRK